MNPEDAPEAPPLIVLWERLTGQLLDRTAAFPKSARFTFASRIDGLSLDVLECLIRGRFAPRSERVVLLDRADGHLAVLRALLRLSLDRRLLSPGAFETLFREIDEAGRMLGGWRRSLRGG